MAAGIAVAVIGIPGAAAARRLLRDRHLVLTLATLLCWLVEHTRWHAALVSIREDEDAAEVFGVPTIRLKSVFSRASAGPGYVRCVGTVRWVS